MPIDTKQKRWSVPGVGRPWKRSVYPAGNNTKQWRMAVGNVYGSVDGPLALIFHAPLNEASGEPVDLTGNHTLLKVGTPTQGEAGLSPYYTTSTKFAGNDRVTVVPQLVIPANSDFSVSLWVKPTATTAPPNYLLGGDSGGDGLGVLRNAQEIEGRFASTNIPVVASTGLAIDVTRHVVMTRVGSSGVIGFYIDSIYSDTTDPAEDSALDWKLDYIGGRTSTASDADSTLADIRIYDYVLTQSLIDSLYQSKSSGWTKSGGLRSVIFDASVASDINPET